MKKRIVQSNDRIRRAMSIVVIALFSVMLPVAAEEAPLSVKTGELLLLELIAPDSSPAGKAARESYRREVKSRLQQHQGSVRNTAIAEVLVGSNNATELAIYRFSNQESLMDFFNAVMPRAPGFNVQTLVISAEQNYRLDFQPDRFYTVSYLWFDRVNPDPFAEYLAVTKPGLNVYGGKRLLVLNTSHGTTSDLSPPPYRVVFEEWQSIEGLEAYLSSGNYFVSHSYIGGGIKKMHQFRLHQTAESAGN